MHALVQEIRIANANCLIVMWLFFFCVAVAELSRAALLQPSNNDIKRERDEAISRKNSHIL